MNLELNILFNTKISNNKDFVLILLYLYIMYIV